MAATSSLSVEIWQMILRYAISVPDFLDPDAFTGVLSKRLFYESSSPLNDEGGYWRTERTRNRMQLVSKSWDSYLRGFEHRFIRILDIRHEKVGAQRLEKAIRVSFGTYQCRCAEFCSKGDFTRFLCQIVERVDSMRVEIVDMMQERRVDMMVSPNFKNVKTLIPPRCGFAHRLALVVSALPSLCHIYGEIYYGKFDSQGNKGLISPNLTTLAFSIAPTGGYDPVMMHLPSLRHLRVDAGKEPVDPNFVKQVILNILRAVGHQLRSFHLHYVPPTSEPLEDVWELCPNMGSLRTAFSLRSPPPFTHPIHTLFIHRVEQLEGLDPYSEWPNLRRIVLGCKWAEFDYRVREAYVPSKNSLLVEDREGLSLDEYCRQSLAWYNPG